MLYITETKGGMDMALNNGNVKVEAPNRKDVGARDWRGRFAPAGNVPASGKGNRVRPNGGDGSATELLRWALEQLEEFDEMIDQLSARVAVARRDKAIWMALSIGMAVGLIVRTAGRMKGWW